MPILGGDLRSNDELEDEVGSEQDQTYRLELGVLRLTRFALDFAEMPTSEQSSVLHAVELWELVTDQNVSE
jgi:hypothetical protein